jgi:iron complex outermembrane receptor protein
VKKYGFDATVAYQPIRELSVYAFGSYLHSEIQNDVEVGRTTAAGALGPIGSTIYAPTAGKRESNAPVYTFGGGATATLDFVSAGFNIKRTGPALPVRHQRSGVRIPHRWWRCEGLWRQGSVLHAGRPQRSRRLSFVGLNNKTYFQLNVLNVFDQLWVGSINSGNGSLNQGPTYNATGTAITAYGNALNSQIGYPRTIMGTLVVGF